MEQEIRRNIPRDLFLHLLAIVTLYWSSVSFVTLIWQIINNYLPDDLNYFYEGINSLIRFSVSSLIIVFPVFILTSWYLNKIYVREYAVRESKIRKWLIYLTLFFAALVIIGDLVGTINMLLGGEITARFILKALSVVAVAGMIFGYYLDDVRKDQPTKLAKPFAIISAVLVIVAVIVAFFVVGSPNYARLTQYDQQKVGHLEGIQFQILNYWQSKEKLPAALSDLNDPISGYRVPVDPQSKASYEYNVKDASKLSFELCANFNKEGSGSYYGEGPKSPYGDPQEYNWSHGEGRTCFERTIDPQRYPPYSKTR